MKPTDNIIEIDFDNKHSGVKTMTDDELHAIHDLLTKDERCEWFARRKEFGLTISIETCELKLCYVDVYNPYGIADDDDTYPVEYEFLWFVRSPESHGWIWEEHLPKEKRAAMYDRIERETQAKQAQTAMRTLFAPHVAGIVASFGSEDPLWIVPIDTVGNDPKDLVPALRALADRLDRGEALNSVAWPVSGHDHLRKESNLHPF
jgi:hypothetical protein